jgi:hypothetical protein
MKLDRKLMALSKTHTLEANGDKLQRSPESIFKKAVRLGLSINPTAKLK